MEFRAQRAFLKAMGAEIIGASEQSHSIQGEQNTPIFGHKYVMNDKEWDAFCEGMNRLGRIAKEEKSVISIGIIGVGRIGQVHTRSICNLVKNAKVKTSADPFMNESTAQWAKSMGKHTTRDYKEILSDQEIDAVPICSSTDTHSPISVEAIKAG